MKRPYKGVFPVVPTTFTESGELQGRQMLRLRLLARVREAQLDGRLRKCR